MFLLHTRYYRTVKGMPSDTWVHFAFVCSPVLTFQLSVHRIPPSVSSSGNKVKSSSVFLMAGKLGCVVVAVDGSEESMKALKWALRNLRLRSQSEDSESGYFVILHVQSPPSIAAGLNPGGIPFGGPNHVDVPAFAAAIEAHQKRITQAIMDHAMRICQEMNNTNVKTQVVIGDPKEMICEVTANLKVDLLVMGSRDFGAIRRMFLGSVSNYCINHVQCPAVVVKGT